MKQTDTKTTEKNKGLFHISWNNIHMNNILNNLTLNGDHGPGQISGRLYDTIHGNHTGITISNLSLDNILTSSLGNTLYPSLSNPTSTIMATPPTVTLVSNIISNSIIKHLSQIVVAHSGADAGNNIQHPQGTQSCDVRTYNSSQVHYAEKEP